MHKNGVEYTYVEDIGYDEYSQRVYIKYGNGVETYYTYDKEMRWLKTVDTANSQGVEYQRMRYEFDDVGNVTKYTNDCLNSNARYKTEQAYGYDALYQLTSVAGTAVNDTWGSYGMGVAEYEGSYSQVFAFDKIGNMSRKASSESVVQGRRVGDDLTYTLNYEYDTNFAHRLKRAGNDLQGWRNYEYDGNGNVVEERDGEAAATAELAPVTVTVTTNAAGEDVYGADYAWGYFKEDNSGAGARGAYRRTYEWNSRGQLIQSSDNDHTVYYVYGTDGERTNKFTSGSETLYFNSMWSWHKDSAIVGQYSKNIYLGTTRLVTKLHNDVNEMPSAQSVTDNCYYYHSDHLGSAQLITDFQGNEYQRLEYTPYGELWIEKTSPVKETKFLPYKFTGKERDEETGLYYYGARYLDAKYSRWLSADPALGEYVPQAGGDNSKLPGMGGVFNIVNLQLYHYAGNNPIRYTDPDGKQASAAVVQPDILDQTAQALITLGTVGVALPEPATTALGTAAFVIGVALINNGSHEHYIPEDLQISCNETTANVVMRDREGNPIPPANQPWPLKGRVNSGPEKISDPSAFGQPGKMPPNMKGPKGKIAAVLTAGALLIDAMKDKILDVANIKAKQKQGMPDAQVDVMSGAAPNMNAKQSENKEDKIIIKNWE